MLLKVDWRNERFSIGLLHARRDRLTDGFNQDKKRSVSAAGMKDIFWIGEDVSYT